MQLQIESTPTITTINDSTCRLWKGVTAKGVQCDVFVRAIAVKSADENAEFVSELVELSQPDELTVPLSDVLKPDRTPEQQLIRTQLKSLFEAARIGVPNPLLCFTLGEQLVRFMELLERPETKVPEDAFDDFDEEGRKRLALSFASLLVLGLSAR